MHRVLAVFLFAISSILMHAQDEPIDKRYNQAYKEKFNQVRYFLGGGRTGEAFLLLQELYKIDSLNHYTNYLIGICYTEQNKVTPLSYKHLEYASRDVMTVYKYIPYTEKKSPVYVWYYLTKAYTQNGKCDLALGAKENFLNRYASQRDGDYFIKNIHKFTKDCTPSGDQENLSLAPPPSPNNSKETNEGYKIKTIAERNIITQEKDYTTKAPIYAIQVGAFKTFVPIREEFIDLKNVEAFLDTTNHLRYIVGRFTLKSQAKHLLDLIKAQGYEDAFIVDVNKTARFKREVVIVDDVSFKAQMRGNVTYSVQIGAYSNTDSIPLHLARIYLQVDQIKEIRDKGLVVLAANKFKTYDAALEHKEKMVNLGIKDAFVIALNNNKKVSLQSANKYLERQQKIEAEKLELKQKKKRKKQDVSDSTDQ